MKPILAIDLDGALMQSRPFDAASKKWFEVMAFILKDKLIESYVGSEDYFRKVNEVMLRLLGNVDELTRTKFARQLYAMLTIAEVKKEDLIIDFANFLKKIKSEYTLALITTAPEECVESILEKVNCWDLFDITFESLVHKQPSKKPQFASFIKKYGKPVFYIGYGDKSIRDAQELGIKSISVNWVKKGKIKGEYDVNTIEELDKVLLSTKENFTK